MRPQLGPLGAVDLVGLLQTVAQAIGNEPGAQSIDVFVDGEVYVTVTATTPGYVRAIAARHGWATSGQDAAGQVTACGAVEHFHVVVSWIETVPVVGMEGLE